MKFVFCGDKDIAVLCLEELVNQGKEISAVFALPSEYWSQISKEGQKNDWYQSLEQFAKSKNIPTYTPKNINDKEYVDIIKKLEPDVLFSISWDQMINDSILEIPKIGAFNIHDSLLPENRGHAPLNWSLIKGYTTTGVSMHKMTRKADQGRIVKQQQVPILFTDSANNLYKKLVKAQFSVFKSFLEDVLQDSITEFEQNHGMSTYGRRRKPLDGIIDWNQSGFDIYNFIRALGKPYPGAFTYFRGKKIFIWSALLYENHSEQRSPGTIIECILPNTIRVQCSRGSILLTSVQLENEIEMVSSEFLNALEIKIGEAFTQNNLEDTKAKTNDMNIWRHMKFYQERLTARVRNEESALDCEIQCYEILKPLLKPHMRLLDAGCATGYYYRTLEPLGIDYYGIDSCPEFIVAGQKEIHRYGLSPKKLRIMDMEDITGEKYDCVIAINSLLYCSNYHVALDRLLNATSKYLLIRTLLGDSTIYRYEEDGYLDENYNHLKAHFNIYSISEVSEFISERGFKVSHIIDHHTKDKPEMVIGKIHPWRILICEREQSV
jgi:methionyl-tRNA formyltransferase